MADEHAHMGQSGPVWFLAGVFNESGPVERDVTIPTGKALFFPVANVEASTIEGNGEAEEELRAVATQVVDDCLIDLSAEIDGVCVEGLRALRGASPAFEFTLPDGNVMQCFGVDAPAGTTSLSVADGIYVMVSPLPEGEHTIRFSAAFTPCSEFALDITYRIRVQPTGGEGPCFRRGDANDDGDVNPGDPIGIPGYLFARTGSGYCLDSMDSNDDGRVDIADPIHLLNFLFLGGPMPPAPGPDACGPDPTDDTIGCTVCISS